MSAVLGLLLVTQLNSFEFSPISTPQYAGDSFTITIVAKDPYGGVYNYNGSALLSTTRDAFYGFVYPNLITFSNGVWQHKVIVTLAETLRLRCVEPQRLVTGQSNVFQVFSGAPEKLLPLLPGEQWAPGSPTGRLPTTPFPRNAGQSFDFDVYVTDAWYNLVRFRNDSVYFGASDSFAQLPAGGQLADGRGTFPATFRQAGRHLLTVLPGGGSPLRSGNSSEFTVNPGVFSQLLLLLPGETHLPGDPTTNSWETPGKAGSPDVQYVQVPFPVTVYACDACWNRVSGEADTVLLGSDFAAQFNPDRSELQDSAVFSAQFTNAGDNQNIWARTSDGRRFTYQNWFDVRPLATVLEISAPDTVRAGDTAYIHVTMRDANRVPIVAAPCRFAVVRGSGTMLDTALLSDTLGRVTARFFCAASSGAEHDTVKVAADVTEYVGIYVDRPDGSPIGAFPNPFGFNWESVTIHYFLPNAVETSVRIYDPFGNEVRSWVFRAGQRGAQGGINRLQWNGRNTQGRRVASGLYVVQVLSEQHTGTPFRKSHRIGVVW